MLVSRYTSLCLAGVLASVLLFSSGLPATVAVDEFSSFSADCVEGLPVTRRDYFAIATPPVVTRSEEGYRFTLDFPLVEDLSVSWTDHDFVQVFVALEDSLLPRPPFDPEFFMEGRMGNRQFMVTWTPPDGFLPLHEYYWDGTTWIRVEETGASFSADLNSMDFFVPYGAVGGADLFGVILWEVGGDPPQWSCHAAGVDYDTGNMEFWLPGLTQTGIQLTAPGEVKIGEPFDISASLLDGEGVPLSGRELMFDVEGVMYDAVTGGDGSASVEHTFTHAGTWEVYAGYVGSNVYAPATVETEIGALSLLVDITFPGPETLPFTWEEIVGSIEVVYAAPGRITLTAHEYPSIVSLELPQVPWEYSPGSRASFVGWSDDSALNPRTFTITEDAVYELNLAIEHLISFEIQPSECGEAPLPEWFPEDSELDPSSFFPDQVLVAADERCDLASVTSPFSVIGPRTGVAEYDKFFRILFDIQPENCGIALDPVWLRESAIFDPADVLPSQVMIGEGERCDLAQAQAPFAVDGPHTISADYDKFFRILFDIQPEECGISYESLWLHENGAFDPADVLPSQVIIGEGERCDLTQAPSPFAVDGPHTVSAEYLRSFLITFDWGPQCGVPIESQWLLEGSPLDPSLIFPDVITISEWDRCVLSSTDPPFETSRPITLEAEYEREFWLAFGFAVSGHTLEEAEVLGILEEAGYSLEEAREILGRWIPETVGVEIPAVPDTFSIEEGVRGVMGEEFSHYDEHGILIGPVEEGERIWSPGTVVAEYSTQYLLTIGSAYGGVLGEGWYTEGIVAEWAVTPSTVPLEGLLGSLGGTLVAEVAEGSVTMSEWTTVVVAWTANYLAPGLTLGVTVALFAGLLYLYWARQLVPILTVGLMAVALATLVYLYFLTGHVIPTMMVGIFTALFTFMTLFTLPGWRPPPGIARFVPQPHMAVLAAAIIMTVFVVLPAFQVTCATECDEDNGCVVEGPDIVEGSVRAVLFSPDPPSPTVRTYRLEMDVSWKLCCWDDCYVFWWDQWKVEKTETVTLDDSYEVSASRQNPTGVAQTVARRKANAYDLTQLEDPTC